jgi:hypothetical protein
MDFVMDMEFFFTQMDQNMKAYGIIITNMASGYLLSMMDRNI